MEKPLLTQDLLFCSRLGNFVKMVDQVILAQFVHIIKSSVAEFTNKVIQNAPETSREAMFKCALQFNKGQSKVTQYCVCSMCILGLDALCNCPIAMPLMACEWLNPHLDKRPN